MTAEVVEHSARGRQLSAAVKSFIEPASAAAAATAAATATAVSALLMFHQPGSRGGCSRLPQSETCISVGEKHFE